MKIYRNGSNFYANSSNVSVTRDVTFPFRFKFAIVMINQLKCFSVHVNVICLLTIIEICVQCLVTLVANPSGSTFAKLKTMS